MIAQNYTAQDLIGKWKVVALVKEINNPNMKDVVQGFKAAVFEFKENKDFKITTANPTQLFKMFTDMTKNAKWKWYSEKAVMHIGSDADDYSIMQIEVGIVAGKTIFHLSETGLDLVVEKEK